MPRVWIEGSALAVNGWVQGKKFNPIWAPGSLRYVASDGGKRAVAGTAARPIIDTNSKKITQHLEAAPGDLLRVVITPESITITKEGGE